MLSIDFWDKYNALNQDYYDLIKKIELLISQEHLSDGNFYIELNIINNEDIQILNAEYRNKNASTDVLSFANQEVEENFPTVEKEIYLGEIFISYPKVLEQAKTFETTAKREFALLLIHGILHLLGYDHIDDLDAQKMEAEENKLLKRIF